MKKLVFFDFGDAMLNSKSRIKLMSPKLKDTTRLTEDLWPTTEAVVTGLEDIGF